ncbi:B12-binding domain-containing protein [Micromonospora sp. Llam0]|uniref:cobalamin B12-binding domain-containing protein n=1 Tax=Micromonospora sp. Llam0 TaxID=2485143 RepID=UPI001F1C2A86|nr:B12-binding domain-containing protein [Micromonospora sp. Llam0]
MVAPSAVEVGGAYPALLNFLAAADEVAALALAEELLAAGVPAESVLLDLIAPAQVQVGRWWQRNEWSVAQEHAATHVSELMVAAVTTWAAPRPHRGRVIVACLDGEWHALPMRLPQAHHTIQACQRADVPVLVGGRGFGPDGRWARAMGVGWAPDARAARRTCSPSPAVTWPARSGRPAGSAARSTPGC